MASAQELRFNYASTRFGQLHYVEQGAGAALLLLHQTPRSYDEFRELIPLLSGARRVIAMDMLGFGASARASQPLTIELLADAALALLDELGIERASILGHHTGAAVAIEIAAGAPRRVDRLVLSSAPWTDRGYRELHANGVGVDEAEHADDGDHLTTLWRQRHPYYPRPSIGLLDRFIHDALAFGVDPTEGHLACARYHMEDRIGLVTAPTLLLGAGDDPFALPDLAPLRDRLVAAASVDTVIIEGGMIPLMEHKPAQVAAAVLPFLSTMRADVR